MMYRDFASVYDELMDDFDYPAWADYYAALIGQYGAARDVCECACGTGSLTVELARRGYRVTASDLSQEMLEVAQRKLMAAGQRAMLVRQDMCALRLPHPADAVIAACDGVNYLLSDERLSAFFRAAHEALRPGGVLAFDVSSPHKLRDVTGNGFFGEERDDVAYLWQNRFSEGEATLQMDLTFFVREADGRYRRFSERHRQKAHRPERLSALLAEAGFSEIRVFGDKTFDPPREDELRLHLAARRGIESARSE